jgi:hypothetical protein
MGTYIYTPLHNHTPSHSELKLPPRPTADTSRQPRNLFLYYFFPSFFCYFTNIYFYRYYVPRQHWGVRDGAGNIQVTIGDGAVNPAFLMKSEDESSSFTSARDTKVTLKAEKLTLLTWPYVHVRKLPSAVLMLRHHPVHSSRPSLLWQPPPDDNTVAASPVSVARCCLSRRTPSSPHFWSLPFAFLAVGLHSIAVLPCYRRKWCPHRFLVLSYAVTVILYLHTLLW